MSAPSGQTALRAAQRRFIYCAHMPVNVGCTDPSNMCAISSSADLARRAHPPVERTASNTAPWRKPRSANSARCDSHSVPSRQRAHAPSRRSRPRSAGAAPAISRQTPALYGLCTAPTVRLVCRVRVRRGRGRRDAAWTLASVQAKQSKAARRDLTLLSPISATIRENTSPSVLHSTASASTDRSTLTMATGYAVGLTTAACGAV